MTKPPADVRELPLAEQGLLALREAVMDVIEDRARQCLPVHIEQDGKVVAVPAEELRAELQSKR